MAEIGEIFVRVFTAFGSGGITGAMGTLSMSVIDLLQLAAVFVCLLMLGRLFGYEGDKDKEILTAPDISAERTMYAGRAAACVYGVLAIALAWFILISSSGTSAFVYFQF